MKGRYNRFVQCVDIVSNIGANIESCRGFSNQARHNQACLFSESRRCSTFSESGLLRHSSDLLNVQVSLPRYCLSTTNTEISVSWLKHANNAL